MANKKQEFVEKALSYVGQGASKFRTWYYGFDAKGVPWCAVFVSYVAQAVGILNEIVKRCEGAGNFPREGVPVKWGTWHEGNTKPEVGDIILFTWNGKGSYIDEGYDKYGSDHVGIVYKVDNNYVYTVEGNTEGNNDSSKVTKRKYALYSGDINGYYRPEWSKVETSNECFETALLQALLRQAYAQGLCKTFVKPIDNKKGKLTKAAVIECRTSLGYKNPTDEVDLKFITELEHQINVIRIGKEDKLEKALEEEQSKLVGDFNEDGKVDIKDATAIQKHLAGVE